jgi:hypothetical protein
MKVLWLIDGLHRFWLLHVGDLNAAFSGQDTRSVDMIWLSTWPIG